jgi:hypothetical protein
MSKGTNKVPVTLRLLTLISAFSDLTHGQRHKSLSCLLSILAKLGHVNSREVEREGLSLFNYTRLRKKGVEATDSCILHIAGVVGE